MNTVTLGPEQKHFTSPLPGDGHSLDDWSREGGLEVGHVLVFIFEVSAGLLPGGHPCAYRHGDRAHRGDLRDLADRGDVGDFGRGLYWLHLQRGRQKIKTSFIKSCSIKSYTSRLCNIILFFFFFLQIPANFRTKNSKNRVIGSIPTNFTSSQSNKNKVCCNYGSKKFLGQSELLLSPCRRSN